jgi:hypothetical protein
MQVKSSSKNIIYHKIAHVYYNILQMQGDQEVTKPIPDTFFCKKKIKMLNSEDKEIAF